MWAHELAHLIGIGRARDVSNDVMNGALGAGQLHLPRRPNHEQAAVDLALLDEAVSQRIDLSWFFASTKSIGW